METIRVTFRKSVVFIIAAVGLPAFIAGWLIAVNFSGVFETGYKIAFLDIKTGLKEAVKDGRPLFILNGIKFYPLTRGRSLESATAARIIPVAADAAHGNRSGRERAGSYLKGP